MNHPKGLTVDDRGNIYIADTMNMAIRKISEAGKCYMCLLKSSLCQSENFHINYIYIYDFLVNKKITLKLFFLLVLQL